MATGAKSRTETASIVAVIGGDEGAVKAAAIEVAARLAPPDAGEFGVEIIDGAADNASGAVVRIHQTVEALQTFPFFGGGKLVWLKSVNFLADSPLGRAAGVIEALDGLAAVLARGLAPDVRFLLSATETDKRRTFYKQLSKVAEVQVHDRLDSSRSGWEEAAAGLVDERSRARGMRLTGEARALFTLLTGGDTRQIENEAGEAGALSGGERPPGGGRGDGALDGAALARGDHLRAGQCHLAAGFGRGAGVAGPVALPRGNADRFVAGGPGADSAQPPAGERPAAALQAAAARFAVCVSDKY